MEFLTKARASSNVRGSISVEFLRNKLSLIGARGRRDSYRDHAISKPANFDVIELDVLGIKWSGTVAGQYALRSPVSHDRHPGDRVPTDKAETVGKYNI